MKLKKILGSAIMIPLRVVATTMISCENTKQEKEEVVLPRTNE